MKNSSIIKTFFRSFLFQAVWNFERMQNVGFLFSIIPCLKDIYRDEKELLRKAALRHFGFFNTHPYIANTIIALIISMENEKASDEKVKSQQIESFKMHLGGPLAAIGDTFFWARLKPVCGLVAVGYFLINRGELSNCFIPLILFLILYNCPHLFFRFFGFRLGLKNKTGVVRIISNLKFKKFSLYLQIAGVLLSVFILTTYIVAGQYPLLGAVFFVIVFPLMLKNISVTSIFWGLVVVSVILGYWVH